MSDLKLLPGLKEHHSAPVPTAGDGEWDRAGGGLGALAKFAQALDLQATSLKAEKFKSVPSPWARALLFEQALFEASHPVHEQVRAEWRGLLAAVGLQKYLKLNVEFGAVNLAERGVIGDLALLLPEDGDKQVWSRLALIKINGHTVGATSPRSLLFPGIRSVVPATVPFARGGRFRDPTQHYRDQRNTFALEVIHVWLDRLLEGLREVGETLDLYLGSRPASEAALSVKRSQLLLKAIEQWRDESRDASSRTVASVAGAFHALDLRTKFPQASVPFVVYSALQGFEPEHRPDADRSVLQPLGSEWILDPGETGIVLLGGAPLNGVLKLPGGLTSNVVDGRFDPPMPPGRLGRAAVDLGKLMSPMLIGLELNHTGAAALTAGGLDFLHPFQRDVLQYLPAEALTSATKIRSREQGGFVVTLEVAVGEGHSVRYEREYGSSNVLTDASSPHLLAWPDFESTEWSDYHYLAYQPSKVGRQIEFSPVADVPIVTEHFAPPGRPFRWWKTTRPVRAWNATVQATEGLLLALPQASVESTGAQWDLAIDFGSTNTCVFRATSGAGGQRTAAEVMLRARTRVVVGGDNKGAFDSFISGPSDGVNDEVPSVCWFPMGKPPEREGRYLPADGVACWDYMTAPPVSAGMLRGNLKWQSHEGADADAFRGFVRQVYLALAAEAAAEGAKVASLVTAMPSVLPDWLRHRHHMTWKALAQDFNVELQPAISEASAVAKYFIATGPATTELLALDVGGSTADIALWDGTKLVANESIKLAGDIVSRLVGRDIDVQRAVAQAANKGTLKEGSLRWSDSDEVVNRLLFNSLMRKLSHDDLTGDLARNLGGASPDGPQHRVLGLAGYLFAVLSFYLGMLVRSSGLQPKRLTLRLAGKGSGFTDWIDVIAANGSRDLVSSFFAAGLNEAGRDGVTLDVFRSPHPKEEVGRGLLETRVLDDGLGERHILVGESGYSADGATLDWSSDFSLATLKRLSQPPQPLTLNELSSLRAFIGAFEGTPVGRRVAEALGLRSTALGGKLEQEIHGAMFGPTSARQAASSADDQPLLEPIFITEAKLLLEHVTGQAGLFRS